MKFAWDPKKAAANPANHRVSFEGTTDADEILPEYDFSNAVRVSASGTGRAAQKKRGEGAGLGLSMVYGIVKQSGGGIAVKSAVGKGSTFRVYLPATTAVADDTDEAPPAPPAGRGNEAVLVVEDNDAVRGFVVQALRDVGYQVTDSGSPLHTLDALAGGDTAYDLLLTDVVLPGIDGYELARRAAAARPSMKVLYMSGYADNPSLREEASPSRSAGGPFEPSRAGSRAGPCRHPGWSAGRRPPQRR